MRSDFVIKGGNKNEKVVYGSVNGGSRLPAYGRPRPERGKGAEARRLGVHDGRLAKEGGYVKDGYTLWMETVNTKGGIKVGNDNYKVEIVFYDDKGDPQTGAKLTEKLITEDKVKFILGPYGSGITLATSAIGEKYKVLTVACQANAVNIYERGFKYIISILPPATYYLRPVIDLSLKVNPPVKTAAVIWADDAFPEYCGKGAAAYAKEKGLQVVYEGKYPKDVKDLSSILLEAKNKKPDILLGRNLLQRRAPDHQANEGAEFRRQDDRSVGRPPAPGLSWKISAKMRSM